MVRIQHGSPFNSETSDKDENNCPKTFGWSLRLTVRTPPFHGGDTGSNPVGITILRSLSSVGRASALQAEGHWFEPSSDHHLNGAVAQLVRVSACHAEGRGFESRQLRHL